MIRGSLAMCRTCGHWYDVLNFEKQTLHENGDCRGATLPSCAPTEPAEGADHCPHGYREATKASCDACNQGSTVILDRIEKQTAESAKPTIEDLIEFLCQEVTSIFVGSRFVRIGFKWEQQTFVTDEACTRRALVAAFLKHRQLAAQEHNMAILDQYGR